MIELIIKQHLESELDVPVYLEHPMPEPESYVIIEKTGGSKYNFLSSATFAVQSYAPSMYQAAVLNDKVKAAMEKLIESSEVSKVKLNSDYNFTDPETKTYRYQAVFDIYHY